MSTRLAAFAAALALWPALASAQFAIIAPDTPVGDSSDRIANTRALQNGLANNPLASGKIFIGSAGGIATGQTMSGDATLSILGALTLATVNANVGTFGSATQCPTLTVNGKGLITAASAATCTPAIGSVTGLGTGVATALGNAVNVSGGIVSPTPTRAGDIVYWNGSAWVTLAGNNSGTNCIQENASGVPSFASCGSSTLTVGTTIVNGGPGILSNSSSGGTLVATAPGTGVLTALGVNVGSAGAFVTFNGALGTPSSGTATNLTGTASGLTAGNVTTNANLTGPVTSVGNATTIGANQVSRANEAQGVARSVIGVTGNATANVADIQGTANQFLGVNSAGTALAFNTMSQDCTLATGVITCLKTNNVSFGALATVTPGTGVATALAIAANAAGGPVTFRAPTVCEINSTSATTCAGGGTQANNGTYTPTAGATRLEIECVGAGGGGAGSGTTPTAAGDGGNSSFSTMTANGGTKGRSDGGLCTGGTVSGADFSQVGALGGPAIGITNSYGSIGGSSRYGGAGYGGPSSNAGGAAAANSGSGGGGAGQGATNLTGGGGCGGGWGSKIISSPSGTYAYAIGALGTAGGAGTSGFAGGAGGAGKCTVKEY